jgi:hypothetical protein
MNDAYTIGITLALENGVSAGIEEIRRDLGELNRTVDTSIRELARLSSQWGATLRALPAVQEPEFTRIAEVGQRLVMRASATRVPPEHSQEVEPKLPSQVGPSAASSPPIAGSPPIAREDAESFSSGLAARKNEPLAMNSMPAKQTPSSPPAMTVSAMAPAQLAIPANARATPIKPDREAVNDVLPAAAPVELPRTPGSELPRTSGSATPAPAAPFLSAVAPADPAKALEPSDLVAFLRRSAPMIVDTSSGMSRTSSPRVETRLAASAGSAAFLPEIFASKYIEGSSEERIHERLLTIAPYPAPLIKANPSQFRDESPHHPEGPAAPTVIAEPRNMGTTAPQPSAKSPAPGLPEQSQLNAPETGHVFLDGQLVGRWMREHLAQMAARPPSGSTGFDPRLGMIWPGAPIQS